MSIWLFPTQSRVHLVGDGLGERDVEADGALVQGEQLGQREAAEEATVESDVMQEHG